ncbi:unnamed protein product, partial [Ectocarpus sp. 13 AM-2016]
GEGGAVGRRAGGHAGNRGRGGPTFFAKNNLGAARVLCHQAAVACVLHLVESAVDRIRYHTPWFDFQSSIGRQEKTVTVPKELALEPSRRELSDKAFLACQHPLRCGVMKL